MPKHHNESSDQNVSDWEYAAAIAAISALMQEDVEAGFQWQDKQYSSWAAACRLESCGAVGRSVVRPIAPFIGKRLWSQARFLVFLLLSFTVLPCLPGMAQLDSTYATGKEQASSNPYNSANDANTTYAKKVIDSQQFSGNTISIRVALALCVPNLVVDIPDGAELRELDSGRCLALCEPQSKLSISAQGQSGITWQLASAQYQNDSQVGSAIQSGIGHTDLPGIVIVPSGSNALFGYHGKLFRGALIVRTAMSSAYKLDAINVLELEDYLLSVVPSEMPSKWPIEALKAQAVAARSYAVSNLGKHAHDGYDLKSTTEDQVYSGVASESSASNRAVAETAGLVLKYQGQVISAFFHSTSGGYTEFPEFVWGKSLPYLKAVPDYDDNSPFFTWSQKIPVSQIEDAFLRSGYRIGPLLAFYVLSRAPSARAQHLLIIGGVGVKVLSSEEIRRVLNLPSSNFNIGCIEDSYVIAGRGFGHGLGLSQWGARCLAENGYNAAQILTYYYKDVSLESL